MYRRHYLTFVFATMLLAVGIQSRGQSINIYRFNNTTNYFPGASLTLFVQLSGVFDLNNQFIVELSDINGNFNANLTVLATLNEFFIPFVNVTIPNVTLAGNQYRIRIRATTANATSATTPSFTIINAASFTPASITVPGFSGSNVTNCLDASIPNFGYLRKNYNDTTSAFQILISNQTNETYTVRIIDGFSNPGNYTVTVLNITSGQFTFPSKLPTGYYIIEIEKSTGGRSSIKSFLYHFNTGNTSLGNSSNESVCVGTNVLFKVDVENIKKNYPGSKYSIEFGDGTGVIEFTHAYLLSNPELIHVYTEATCSSPYKKENENQFFFKTNLKLYNKGIGTSANDCLNYNINGNGTTKWINASTPPKADFETTAFICKGREINALNTSIAGAYGSGAICNTNMYTIWSVKKPSSPNYLILVDGVGKLNLNIPSDQVNEMGCWSIRLEVKNLEGCDSWSTKEKTVGVEPPPIAKFGILLNGQPSSQICFNQTVTLQDSSNIASLNCQNPTYSWTISPGTGWNFVNNTTASSSNPQVTFTAPGTYYITQQISNSCQAISITNIVKVLGTPSVSFPVPDKTICQYQPADTTIDFSQSPFRPTYSTGAYTPAAYQWRISGTGVTATDYEFTGGTNESSQYPKIRFKAYKTYTISLQVNGSCNDLTNATLTITLKPRPRITNTNLTQALCSNTSFTTVNLTADLIGTTFSWTTTVSPAGSVNGYPPSSNGTSIIGATLTNNTAASGILSYRIVADSGGCSSDPAILSITVHPIPPLPSVTNPVNYCLNAAATPLAATANTNNTLLWYSNATGGTGASTAPVPATNAIGSTTYYVSQLSNTSPACESGRATITVNVYAIPSITGTYSNPTNCSNPDGRITLTGLNAATTYTVQYRLDGIPTSISATADANGQIILNNLRAGTYDNITVTLNGCTSNVVGPFQVANPAAPTNVTASSNGPLCSGSSLSLTANSSLGANASYSWIGPNNFSSNLQNPSINNISALQSGNYYVTASVNGCSSPQTTLSVTVITTPSAPPAAATVNYCQNATASALSATAATGNTLLWYTTATGGVGAANAPVPSTTALGNTVYYVSQVTTGNPVCEGPRSSISVNVYAIPTLTVATIQPTNCTTPDGKIILSSLTVNTAYVVSYKLNGNTVTVTLSSNNNGVIELNNLGAGTYENITVTLNGCTSTPGQSFTLTNPSAPSNVVANNNGPLCSGNTLTLTGNSSALTNATYQWSGPNGFSSSLQNPSLSNVTTTMAGNYLLTATQNGCVSTIATTAVTINQTPVAPVVSTPVQLCQNATASPLSAQQLTGNTLYWYTVAAGGTGNVNAPVPSTVNIGSTTYYVSQGTPTNPVCESPRQQIVVNVYAVPAITGSFTNPDNCLTANGSIRLSGLTANTTYRVDYTKNGGVPVSVVVTADGGGDILFNTLTAGNYSNITVTLNGCTSNILGPYTLTNPDAPSAVTAESNGPLCSGNTLTIRGNSSAGTAATYTWTGPNNYQSTQQNPSLPSATVAMSGTYSVTATLNGCASAAKLVDIIVHQTPGSPAATSPVNFCENAVSTALTAIADNGNTLLWYNTATGGTGTSTAPVPPTSAIGSTTYYVSQLTPTTPGCESIRSAIVVNVFDVPEINGSFTHPTNCLQADGTISLSGLAVNTTYNIRYSKNGAPIVTTSLTTSANGTVTIANLTPGTYDNISVSLNGCQSNTAGPFVLVNPAAPSNVTASSNAPLCSGAALQLNAASSEGDNATYSWNGPNNFTSTLRNPLINNATASMTGAYSVTATRNGCISPAALVNITVIQTPATPAVVSPVKYCEQTVAIPLTATADAGNTLVWYAVAAGGTPLVAAPTPPTTTVGTLMYYVSQRTPTTPACESPRTTITVNILEVPFITATFTHPTNCITPDGSITINGLRSNTTYEFTYDRNGIATPATITTNANGTVTINGLREGNYENIMAILNGCPSNKVGPFLLKNPAAPANLTIASNGPLCSGNPLQFTSGSSEPNATYNWSGPAGFASGVQNPRIESTTSAMTGAYSVTATIYGCTSAPATLNVVIYATPAAPDATSPVNYCLFDAALPLTAHADPGNSLSWYTSATGGTGSTTAPTPSTATLGTTTFYVSQQTPTNPVCESNRKAIDVTINPIPSIGATATPPTTCTSSNGIITLTGLLSNSPYQVYYTMNGVNVNTTIRTDANGNIQITNMPSATYSNVYVAQYGCPSNVVGPFRLINPDIPSAPDANSNSPLCAGERLQLTSSSQTNGVTYSWSGPGGFSSTSQNPIIDRSTVAQSGRYYVKAIRNNCTSDADSIDVLIQPNPVVNVGPDLLLPPASQYTLTATIQYGPAASYLWSPAKQLSCTTCPSPVATIWSDIAYVLQVKNVNGCIGMDTVNIIALCGKEQVFIPNAFTPDGDGINDRLVIRSSGLVQIRFFRLFNRWGEIVFERNNFLPNDNNYAWDGYVKGVPSAPDVYVYTAEIICESGRSFIIKGNVTVLK